MKDDKALAVLASYNADLERWKANGGHYKDVQPLTINDILFIRKMLHPTKRADSKKVTEELIKYLCEQEVTTAKDIYEATGLSDKPVLIRLKVFQQFGLIRRESKKYYLPTPRLYEINEKYLKRVCE